MRFWDSSALVPLLVSEPRTRAVKSYLDQDDDVLVWWGTETECISALARMERGGLIPARSSVDSFRRLERLKRSWQEVQPNETVRRVAARILRVHTLRAADALQIAAAVVGSEDHAGTLVFVSFDGRQNEAAAREGFVLAELSAAV